MSGGVCGVQGPAGTDTGTDRVLQGGEWPHQSDKQSRNTCAMTGHNTASLGLGHIDNKNDV